MAVLATVPVVVVPRMVVIRVALPLVVMLRVGVPLVVSPRVVMHLVPIARLIVRGVVVALLVSVFVHSMSPWVGYRMLSRHMGLPTMGRSSPFDTILTPVAVVPFSKT